MEADYEGIKDIPWLEYLGIGVQMQQSFLCKIWVMFWTRDECRF